MKLSEFKYYLPQDLIALHPVEERDEARMMVLDRKTKTIEHRLFKDIIDYFDEGDLFVMNNTRVFPALLYGEKEQTRAQIRVFLLRELDEESRLWDVLVDPARKIRIGNKLSFCEDDSLVAEVIDNTTSRGRTLRFLFDGDHDALIVSWDAATSRGIVDLGMREVSRAAMHQLQGGWFLDTGSPHFVLPVSDLEHFDVVGEGRRLRYRDDLFPQGANIDFIENLPDGRLFVRTYERGVEDETWACGTGVTACAIVSGNHRLVTRGGDFSVSFSASETCFANIRLVGPVSLNFKGLWTSSAR